MSDTKPIPKTSAFSEQFDDIPLQPTILPKYSTSTESNKSLLVDIPKPTSSSSMAAHSNPTRDLEANRERRPTHHERRLRIDTRRRQGRLSRWGSIKLYLWDHYFQIAHWMFMPFIAGLMVALIYFVIMYTERKKAWEAGCAGGAAGGSA